MRTQHASWGRAPSFGPLLATALLAFVWVVEAAAGSLAKGALAGVLLDDDGLPVARAGVTLNAKLSTPLRFAGARTTTNSDGGFLFSGLEPGRYFVSVAPPDSRDLEADVFFDGGFDSPRTQAVEVLPGKISRLARRLRRAGRLEVTVMRGTEPWPATEDRWRLSFELIGPLGSYLGTPSFHEGRYVFRWLLPGSDYRLRFRPVGYAHQLVTAVSVAAGSATQLSVQDDPTHPTGVSGILRAPTGEEISAAAVFLQRHQGGDAHPSGDAVTDATGRYRIVGLPPGRYLASVVAGTRFGTDLGLAEVVAGQVTLLDLIFIPDLPLVPGATSALLPEFHHAPASAIPIERAISGLAAQQKWPLPGSVVIKDCGNAEQLPWTHPLYRKVFPQIVTGIAAGIACLENRAPVRAARLRTTVESGPIPTMFFGCSPNDMDSGSACAVARAVLPFGTVIQFSTAALGPSCGCLEAVVFHEMVHVTSASTECPAYACEAACFPCGTVIPGYCTGNERQCCDP